MAYRIVDEHPIEYPDLPCGWEVHEYTNPRGRTNYACYIDGKRVAYGMGTPGGAVRAAQKALSPSH